VAVRPARPTRIVRHSVGPGRGRPGRPPVRPARPAWPERWYRPRRRRLGHTKESPEVETSARTRVASASRRWQGRDPRVRRFCCAGMNLEAIPGEMIPRSSCGEDVQRVHAGRAALYCRNRRARTRRESPRLPCRRAGGPRLGWLIQTSSAGFIARPHNLTGSSIVRSSSGWQTYAISRLTASVQNLVTVMAISVFVQCRGLSVVCHATSACHSKAPCRRGMSGSPIGS